MAGSWFWTSVLAEASRDRPGEWVYVANTYSSARTARESWVKGRRRLGSLRGWEARPEWSSGLRRWRLKVRFDPAPLRFSPHE